MKRLLSVLLALCLMLTVCCLPAAATDEERTTIEIWSAEDFYAAFEPHDGTVTIPANTAAVIHAESLYIEETIVVEAEAVLIIVDRASLNAERIENNGTVGIYPESVLSMHAGGDVVNNGDFSIVKDGIFVSDGGGLINNGGFYLIGIYVCGVTGADGEQAQSLAYTGDGEIYCMQGSHVVLQPYGENAVDFGAATTAVGELFGNACAYAWATSFDEIKTFNSDPEIDGIFVCSDGEGDPIVRVTEDLTIGKRLCISPCDLLLQHGATLSIADYENNLLMLDGGRIVTESMGAAGPECPTGGTLVLNGVAVMSGDADKGAVNPTRDIIWVASRGSDDTGHYPGPANEIQIGDWSEAEAHGDISALSELDVVMVGGESKLNLTDDFTCARIGLNGDVELNGHVLTAGEVFFSNDSRIHGDSASVKGNYRYQVRVKADPLAYCEHPGLTEGDRLWLEDNGIPYADLEGDDSFRGWRFDSGWDIPREEFDGLEVKVEDDEDSEQYGEHYIIVPAFPLEITAEWSTQRVELTQYDMTVAFEGIEGHDYSLSLIDSVHSIDEELEAIGASREMLDAVTAQLEEEIPEGDVLFRLFNFSVSDGEHEAIIDPYEVIVPLDEAMQNYRYLSVQPVRIRDDGAFIDGDSFNTRVEDGKLIAQMPDCADAYIIVGSNADPSVVGSVHLSLERPESGLVTDTPYDEEHREWRWRDQQNRPRVNINGLRGAYVGEAYWTLADDPDEPFIGTMENGKVYGLSVTMLAEPDCCFADDVKITIDGAEYVGHTTHLRDEDGKADILVISCTFKPIPTDVILGDTDGDSDVTILDATYIQRELAGLSNPCFVDEASDVDGDGDMTILDATFIQRWLAGINDPYPIGTLLIGSF